MIEFGEATKKLAIFRSLDKLLELVQKYPVSVLSATPGAGKSTIVPLSLLNLELIGDKKIIMLEPRRLAAKLLANRMAELLGEAVGNRVGYIIRGERAISKNTQIEIVTEGVFTKIIQDDPFLSEYKVVIFDEFHERNINSDLGLAFANDCRKNLREDLKILIMSGSLNSQELADKFAAEVVNCEDRLFDLKVNFAVNSFRNSDYIRATNLAIHNILSTSSDGDILVFLPGAGDIGRVHDLLDKYVDSKDVAVYDLYGNLDKQSQDLAIRPEVAGRRKVILSTNIAESSVTIPAIKFVVDCGLEKRLIFDISSSLNRLVLRTISKSSAIQRANRAGRVSSGEVYRLYSERDYENFAEHIAAEIEEIELSNFALELALWGSCYERLDFLSPKPENALAKAYELLKSFQVIRDDCSVTPFGKKLSLNPTSVRLSLMLEKSKELNLAPLACELVAVLEENYNFNDNDIEQILHEMRRRPTWSYQKSLKQFLTLNRLQYQELDTGFAGLLLSFGFRDFVGKKRNENALDYQLASGSGASLRYASSLSRGDYIVALKVEKGQKHGDGLIHLAARIELEDLQKYFANEFRSEKFIEFDEEKNRFYGWIREYFREVLVSEKTLNVIDDELIRERFEDILSRKFEQLFLITKRSQNLYNRLKFAYQNDSDLFACFEPKRLFNKVKEAIFAKNINLKELNNLKKLDFYELLSYSIDYNKKVELDKLYPEKFVTPCGSGVFLDYRGDEIVLAVKITEMYGTKEHIMVGNRKLPVKIELLSPASRIVQITKDLPEFWRENYKYVQKEMKSQYIKHYWPDNPLEAEPTKKVKNKI